MDKTVALAPITEIKELRKNLFQLTFFNEIMCKNVKVGQFVHIKCGDDTYLRRPISIYDAKDGFITVIFEIRGKGTKALSQKKEGEILNVLGPLGNGYTVLDKSKKVFLVGGGIGIFPLYLLAKHHGKNATVVLGFRSKDFVITEEDFKATGAKVFITTDDGSYGEKCFVTNVLSRELENVKYDAIFACGPLMMLKETARISAEKDIFCEVSMEERMACGLGFCLCCAVPAKINDHEEFLHVCKNGPIFNAKEVFYK